MSVVKKLEVQGTTYEVPEADDLTTKELRDIKDHTGLMGLRGLIEGLHNWDPDALVAMVYVAKSRAGTRVTWAELDNLRPFKDIQWIDDEDEGNGEELGQSNPPTSTESGTTPEPAATATSDSSPTTSVSPLETSMSSP